MKKIIEYKSFIIYHHASHHEKEDVVALPKIQQKGKFGHQVNSHKPSKWCRCHLLVDMK